jgi:hypothetical protein
MADDPARDGRAARARRPPQRPGQAAPPSGAAHRAIPRPTDGERQEAERVLDAMRALRMLRGKTTHTKAELIALALAWRRRDVSLQGLDDAACLELFGIVDGSTDARRSWVLDADRRRIEQAEQYLALPEAERASFVADVPTEDERQARKRQRHEGECDRVDAARPAPAAFARPIDRRCCGRRRT